MRSADEVEVVPFEELRDDVLTEGEGDTAVVLAPTLNVLIGVGPEKIAEETVVGHVGGTHDAADLLHGLEVRRETTVHAEDLLVDDGSNWQAVEAICESLPKLDVVAPLACGASQRLRQREESGNEYTHRRSRKYD